MSNMMGRHADRKRRPRRDIKPGERGFTFVEMMIIVGVIGILASTSVAAISGLTSRAKRVESQQILAMCYNAQREFYTRTRRYAGNFRDLRFKVEGKGARRVSDNLIETKSYSFQILQPGGDQTFRCHASGDIDGDAYPDVLFVERDDR